MKAVWARSGVVHSSSMLASELQKSIRPLRRFPLPRSLDLVFGSFGRPRQNALCLTSGYHRTMLCFVDTVEMELWQGDVKKQRTRKDIRDLDVILACVQDVTYEFK